MSPPTTPPTCSKNEFLCDGACQPGFVRCDGEDDCADKSDEFHCGKLNIWGKKLSSDIKKYNLQGYNSLHYTSANCSKVMLYTPAAIRVFSKSHLKNVLYIISYIYINRIFKFVLKGRRFNISEPGLTAKYVNHSPKVSENKQIGAP